MAAGEVPTAQVNVRVGFGEGLAVSVATGLPVLDHLVGALARSAGMQLTIEVAPGTADQEAVAAGRAFGEALAAPLRAPEASGHGFAWLPADEALAGAVLEVSERPLLASNVDFSGQRVGGLQGDVVARFLEEFAAGASLNVHIRVLEGKDPQNVLLAIFKALGAAIGRACRPSEGGKAE
jgi:imidazoleglycerol-phosphate dehydratase